MYSYQKLRSFFIFFFTEKTTRLNLLFWTLSNPYDSTSWTTKFTTFMMSRGFRNGNINFLMTKPYQIHITLRRQFNEQEQPGASHPSRQLNPKANLITPHIKQQFKQYSGIIINLQNRPRLELAQYFTKHTYLGICDKWFWALPPVHKSVDNCLNSCVMACKTARGLRQVHRVDSVRY
jgi:hypothetical protein